MGAVMVGVSACSTQRTNTPPPFLSRWLDKDKDDGQLVRELLPSDSNATLKSELSQWPGDGYPLGMTVAFPRRNRT